MGVMFRVVTNMPTQAARATPLKRTSALSGSAPWVSRVASQVITLSWRKSALLSAGGQVSRPSRRASRMLRSDW